MIPLRLAIATRCFQLPFKQAVSAAAEAGAAGVQFDVRNELKPAELSESGRRQLSCRLNELGIAAASLHFPARRPFYAQDALDARIDAVKKAMQFAWQMHCRVVTSRIGRIPEDRESADYQILTAVINDLSRHANQVGAVLAITPTRDSPQALADLIGRIDAGPIGVNLDPAAFVIAGYNPAEAFRKLHEHVTHVQLRDAISDIDGTGAEVAVGRGEVEWDELLAVLDEAGYDGWLTAERTTGPDPAGDVARALQYVRNVAAG